MPAVAAQAIVVDRVAAIQLATRAFQKSAVTAGTSRIAAYMMIAWPPTATARTASQPIWAETRISRGRMTNPITPETPATSR